MKIADLLRLPLELQRETWQGRVLEVLALADNELAHMHARILFHAWEQGHTEPPYITRKRGISKQAVIVADYVDRYRVLQRWQPIMPLAEFVYGFRRVADRAKLSDADRVELFDLLRAWAKPDRRVNYTGELFPNVKVLKP